MTSLKTRSSKLFGFPAVAGALVLALWLATPIAAPAQTFNVLKSFNGADGAYPKWASLAQGRGGNFYGTTEYGGANNSGEIFKMTREGKLSVLYSFCARTDCADGANPWGALILATDGNFYGMTSVWGPNGGGTVFKVTPGGTLTTLYSFCAQPNCADGEIPSGGLAQATDGNFYGTTLDGGTYSNGTIFAITPQGELTTLYSFCAQSNCADGARPYGDLIQATDGNFYGTTYAGGNGTGCGTVFRITPGGALTTLYSFGSVSGDGCRPLAGLLQGADANFYGTTPNGGNYGVGNVFRLSPSGTLTTLYSFCSQSGCADGSGPEDPLIQATDGNLYGTTWVGGANSLGTVFQITTAGVLTTLHSFCGQKKCTDGSYVSAGLLQGTNGTFYGPTYMGGAHNVGTLYSLDMGLGPFVAFVRDLGRIGANVQILGQGFTGTTGVSFNGTPASFTVHSDTYLTAIVPNGATTGYVTVITPGGTLQSNVKFRVRQ